MLGLLIFNVRIALTAIAATRMRSALTLLGVTIGVFAVTIVLSLGEYVRNSVSDTFGSFGSNMVILTAQGENDARRITLTLRNAQSIARQVREVDFVAPQIMASGYSEYDGKYKDTTAYGVTVDYFRIRNMKVGEGRALSESEWKGARREVMVSRALADELFGKNTSATGKIFKYDNVPLYIVGVLASSEGGMNISRGGEIYMPMKTLRQRFRGSASQAPDDIDVVYIRFKPGIDLNDGQVILEAYLRRLYRVSADAPRPFTLINTQEFVARSMQAIHVVELVLGTIASISLLVGAIGIMNIMLVSVSERTREIGIRLAVGAPPRFIRAQFLTEAAILCLLGGLAGLVLAASGLKIAGMITKNDFGLSLGLSLLLCLFSVAIGLIAGYVPAARASRLDPIEALRTP